MPGCDSLVDRASSRVLSYVDFDSLRPIHLHPPTVAVPFDHIQAKDDIIACRSLACFAWQFYRIGNLRRELKRPGLDATLCSYENLKSLDAAFYLFDLLVIAIARFNSHLFVYFTHGVTTAEEDVSIQYKCSGEARKSDKVAKRATDRTHALCCCVGVRCFDTAVFNRCATRRSR